MKLLTQKTLLLFAICMGLVLLNGVQSETLHASKISTSVGAKAKLSVQAATKTTLDNLYGSGELLDTRRAQSKLVRGPKG